MRSAHAGSRQGSDGAESDDFGYSVALSSSGDYYALVGAPWNEDSGSAYMFDLMQASPDPSPADLG